MAIRGEGGGYQVKFLDFLGLDICCRPTYLVFKMGSLSPQLARVAEIWRVKGGSFSRVFGYLYRKIGQNWSQILINFFLFWATRVSIWCQKWICGFLAILLLLLFLIFDFWFFVLPKFGLKRVIKCQKNQKIKKSLTINPRYYC